MDRRRFLTGGAAAATLPMWTRAATRGARGSDLVEHAFEAARALGKPLLVVLVPADEALRAQRGQLFGRLFSNASEEVLADLSLCTVVCAEETAAREALGSAWPQTTDVDAAVLVETVARGARVISGEGLGPVRGGFGQSGEHVTAVRAQLTELGQRLRAAILPDEDALRRRAVESLETLHPEESFGLVRHQRHGARVKRGHAERVAAQLLSGAESDEDRAFWRHELAEATLLRLFERDPAGAEWDYVNDYCPPCGMGHTPEISKHFLRFYTE